MFRVLFIFFCFWKKRRRVKRDVLDIISRSIFIARFCVHKRDDDDGDTNDDAARTRDDDTGGGRGKGDRRRRLFVFVKVFFFFFFFVVVVYVVVFRDWIFGYERRWLSLSMMISFRLDAQRAWHDLTFLFLSLPLWNRRHRRDFRSNARARPARPSSKRRRRERRPRGADVLR